MKIKLLFLALFVAFSLTSCDEEDDKVTPTNSTNNNGNNNGNNNNSIAFSGADGTLIAVQSASETIAGTIMLNTGVAAFNDTGTATSVGIVSVEGEDLTENSAGSYTISASQTNPSGPTFTQPIDWVVEGANGFTGFTEANADNFPKVDPIQSATTVDKSDGYKLETTSVSNSDSVLFTIGNVTRALGADAIEYTFSPAELSSLANGTTVASIAPYNFYNKDKSGKDIYFVNESVVQLNVTVQD